MTPSKVLEISIIKAPTATRPVVIRIDEDIKTRVERLAEVRKCAPHVLMREAISQYVEREEKREATRNHVLKAWAAYQLTGLHVTAAEADEWLVQLVRGEDVEPPEAHE